MSIRALGLGQGLLPPFRPVAVAQVEAQVWAPGVRAPCVLDSSSCRGGGQGVRSSSPAQFRFFLTQVFSSQIEQMTRVCISLC